MNKDLVIIFVTSVVAAFNPTLLAAAVVMIYLPHPRRLMLGYLAGAYASSITAGLAIAFSLRESTAVETSGHILGPGGDIAVGVIAMVIALTLATGYNGPLQKWHVRRKAAKASAGPARPPWQQRMLEKGSAVITCVVGAVMSFPGVSYLNALHHLVELNPPAVPTVLLVIYFCLMQQILLELALLAYLLIPAGTQAAVVRFRAWLARHVRRIAEIGLAGIGILLLTLGVIMIA